MFVLTGDVHDFALNSCHKEKLGGNQTELGLSEKYLDICNSAGISPTLYITGLTAVEDPQRLSRIIERYDLEIAGHTYNAYSKRLFYYLCKNLFGLACGPRFLQELDVRKTGKAICDVTGRQIVSWRGHGYRQDRNTLDVLIGNGLRTVSNEVSPGARPYRRNQGRGEILVCPINTTPDHENLPHCSPGARRGISDWTTTVLSEVERNMQRGIVSIILAHPACMKLEDDMKEFGRMVSALSRYQSCTMAELAGSSAGE